MRNGSHSLGDSPLRRGGGNVPECRRSGAQRTDTNSKARSSEVVSAKRAIFSDGSARRMTRLSKFDRTGAS